MGTRPVCRKHATRANQSSAEARNEVRIDFFDRGMPRGWLRRREPSRRTLVCCRRYPFQNNRPRARRCGLVESGEGQDLVPLDEAELPCAHDVNGVQILVYVRADCFSGDDLRRRPSGKRTLVDRTGERTREYLALSAHLREGAVVQVIDLAPVFGV